MIAVSVAVGFGLAGGLTSAAAQVTLLSRSGLVSDTAMGQSFTAATAARSTLSADGRFVVFLSSAINVVSGQVDTPLSYDAFLFDRQTATNRLVTRRDGTTSEAVGVDGGAGLAISDDGSCVVFTSASAQLVAGQVDTNGEGDVFLFEVTSGNVVLVSHAAGTPASAGGAGTVPSVPLAVSDDCRYVAYASFATDLVVGQVDTVGSADVFLFDRQTGTTTLVSHQAGASTTAAGGCSRHAASGDGRFVAFASTATNLVAGQVDTNAASDVFLFDRAVGTSVVASHASSSSTTTGAGASREPAVSGDGAYVAYVSAAGDLVAGHSDPNAIAWDVFLYDRAAGGNLLASRSAASATTSGSATARDLEAPALSDDGRYVAFASDATNLVAGQVDAATPGNDNADVFLFDRVAGGTILVSHTGESTPSTVAGNRGSVRPQLSADGARLAFESGSSLGYPDSGGRPDVFLFVRATGVVWVVSRAYDTPNGVALGNSYQPALSADGRFVAYSSTATDIELVDTNGLFDVFLFDGGGSVEFGTNEFVSRRAADMPSLSGNGGSFTSLHYAPTLSADGRYAAFTTFGTDVFEHYGPVGEQQVVVADRISGDVRLGSQNRLHGAASLAASAPALTADGGAVAFVTAAPDVGPPPPPEGPSQVFLQGSGSGSSGPGPGPGEAGPEPMVLVSHSTGGEVRGNGHSETPITAANGRVVAFASLATDLVAAAGDTNGSLDVFVAELAPPSLPSIVLVSRAFGAALAAANGASFGPRLSSDGRWIAFTSLATNLISGIVDTNNVSDAFLHDRSSGSSVLVSHSAGSATAAANGDSVVLDLSADGRFVLFQSGATNVVPGQVDTNAAADLFLHDRTTGTSQLVTRASGTVATAGSQGSITGGLAAGGRYAVFWSQASNLVAGQVDAPSTADLFWFDVSTGELALVSHTAASTISASHGWPFESTQSSADGRFIVWASEAVDVTAGQVDANGAADVFVYDRVAGGNRLISRTPDSATTAGNGSSYWPWISADGRSIIFTSDASDLVANDRNASNDVFLDRAPSVPGAFFTVSPCRLHDSRMAGGALTTNVPRALAVHAACGVPSTATAVSVNLTVVSESATGFAVVFAGDQPPPGTSTLNFSPGQVRANNTVASLALDGSGRLDVVAAFAGGGPVHAIVDVNGYFE